VEYIRFVRMAIARERGNSLATSDLLRNLVSCKEFWNSACASRRSTVSPCEIRFITRFSFRDMIFGGFSRTLLQTHEPVAVFAEFLQFCGNPRPAIDVCRGLFSRRIIDIQFVSAFA